jgi:hypothetical protein
MKLYSEDEMEDYGRLYQEIIKIIIRRSHPDSPDHPTIDQIMKLESTMDRIRNINPELGKSIWKLTSHASALINTIKDSSDPIWEKTPHPFINP